MRHVVVFQFDDDCIDDFDQLVALEDNLAESINEFGQLDGHDAGSGEVNYFFLSDAPKHAFESARPFLEREGLLAAVRVAYRLVDGEEYTLLWPNSSKSPFRVA